MFWCHNLFYLECSSELFLHINNAENVSTIFNKYKNLKKTFSAKFRVLEPQFILLITPQQTVKQQSAPVAAISWTVTTLRDFVAAETKFLRKLKQSASHERLNFVVVKRLLCNERVFQQPRVVWPFSNVLLQTIPNTTKHESHFTSSSCVEQPSTWTDINKQCYKSGLITPNYVVHSQIWPRFLWSGHVHDAQSTALKGMHG